MIKREFRNVSSIEELENNQSAMDIISKYREKTGIFCPRCGSNYIKSINTLVFRELLRCVDCEYMFNGMSGSVFQGIKIPLIKYLQAIIVFDYSNGKPANLDMSFALDVTSKTASHIIKKITPFGTNKSYLNIGNNADTLIQISEGNHIHRSNGRFIGFCAMHGILVNRDDFLKRIEMLLDQDRTRVSEDIASRTPRKTGRT